MSENLEALTFDEAFAELEATVRQLENTDLSLEDSMALYEHGMRLAKRCGDALDAAELRVQQLTLVDGQQQMGMFFPEETG